MFLEIGERSNARKWLKDKMNVGGRIMGFGHRIYRTEDPRSRALKPSRRELHRRKFSDLAESVEEDARELLREKHPEEGVRN